MKKDENLQREYEKLKEFETKEIKIGKILGQGAYGLVAEVKYKKEIYAGKFITKEGNSGESELIKQFKSPYIVKIIKIFESKSGLYNFVLMEKADLKDLNSFINNRNHNAQQIIIDCPYDGIVSDNLMKYFTKHLVYGLEALERIGFSHFDIKPGNILIFNKYILKLSDFSFLKRQKDLVKNNLLLIPGGSNGYSPPEYYLNKLTTLENAKRHDYFSLGSTLFFLKYGKRLIDFPYYYAEKSREKKIEIIDYIYNILQRQINLIKASKLSSKGFINFLSGLIQYNPEDRLNFEEIYRDKWLNSNREEINKLFHINEANNSKLIQELNKSDFLLDKRKELDKNRKKFKFKK